MILFALNYDPNSLLIYEMLSSHISLKDIHPILKNIFHHGNMYLIKYYIKKHRSHISPDAIILEFINLLKIIQNKNALIIEKIFDNYILEYDNISQELVNTLCDHRMDLFKKLFNQIKENNTMMLRCFARCYSNGDKEGMKFIWNRA